MAITTSEDRVCLSHSSGASADILLYGATVISWRTASSHTPHTPPTERLYTSRSAALDGSKPVRGGIPLVFPFFGRPSRPEHAALSQHGYARSTLWQHLPIPEHSSDGSGGDGDGNGNGNGNVSARFLLPARDGSPALSYTVALSAHTLTSTLTLAVPAHTPPFTFQALFHTYIRAAAPRAAVSPLQGTTYIDKMQPGHPGDVHETRALVDVRAPTDSVYKAPSSSTGYDIDTGDGGKIHMHMQGIKDVVVWNPGEAAGRKMADLEEGGWDMFVAVEPGAASYWIECAPGETWTGTQVLTAVE